MGLSSSSPTSATDSLAITLSLYNNIVQCCLVASHLSNTSMTTTNTNYSVCTQFVLPLIIVPPYIIIMYHIHMRFWNQFISQSPPYQISGNSALGVFMECENHVQIVLRFLERFVQNIVFGKSRSSSSKSDLDVTNCKIVLSCYVYQISYSVLRK